MELIILEEEKTKIAEVKSDEIVLNSTQDGLDLMADAYHYGANSVILREKNFTPEFFDLSTKLAGDILQKFSTYRVKIAIVGEFEKYKSNSLQAFIGESNRGKMIFFVPDKKTAISKIIGKE